MSKMCLEKFEKTFGGGRMNPRKFEKNLSHDSGVGVLRVPPHVQQRQAEKRLKVN